MFIAEKQKNPKLVKSFLMSKSYRIYTLLFALVLMDVSVIQSKAAEQMLNEPWGETV